MNSACQVIGSVFLEGAVTVEDTIIRDTGSGINRVTAEGTLQDTDVENRNKRIYETKDMAEEIRSQRIQELVAAKQMKGEHGHPLTNDLVRQQTIDPKLTSVSFLKIWMDKNLIKAVFKGTNNAYGAEFDADLRDGCKPAFSLRALGGLITKNGKAYVQKPKIVTWDHVIFPSHRVAYTEKVLSESYVVEKNIVTQQFIVPNRDPGTVIHLTNSDAVDALNRLQRESANIGTILDTFEGLYEQVTVLENNNLCLSTRYGEKLVLPMDKYVTKTIMDYAFKM